MKKKKIKLAYQKTNERWVSKKSRDEIIRKYLRDRKKLHFTELGLVKWIKIKNPEMKTHNIKIGDVIRYQWSGQKKRYRCYSIWKIGRYMGCERENYEIKTIVFGSIMIDFYKKRDYIFQKATKKEREAYETIENVILASEVAEKI